MVLGLIEEISVEFYDVRVVLGLEQLNRLFFVLIKLIKSLNFDLFERIVLIRSDVPSLVHLSVVLARRHQVDFLKVLLSKHIQI